MADLNGGHGKFQGVDENVNYAVSFTGATKVAEKVKKGGTEKKSDGYVVDAIDIDWGGLKLTTIAEWRNGLQTVASTEQNAGKGDNTKGIHSTAYLLNLISSSFTQIYNEIGGNDNAGLRKKIADLDTSIKQITGSDPGQLANIRDRIQKIEQELDNPGAANTLVTILDTLEGFDKNKKGDVKNYIDVHDQALLGASTDAATADTIWGAKNYANTTVKNSLIGKAGDNWDAQKTLYGVVKYSDTKNTDLKNALIGSSTDTTINTHYGLKHILIGNTADTTINTHWGVKNSLIGTDSDTKDSNTIKGAKKYADNVQTNLIGKSTDASTADTIWGAKNYATTVQSSLLGASGDAWPTQHTLYGVVKYTDEAKASVIGTSYDAITADTIWGAKKYAENYADTKDGEVVDWLIGVTGDLAVADTIWGAKNYAKEKVSKFAESLIGTSYDTAINTHFGIINTLRGTSADASTAPTIWGAKKYAVEQCTIMKSEFIGNFKDDTENSDTIWGAKKYADHIKTLAANDAKYKDDKVIEQLIGKPDDTSVDTHWGAVNFLVGASGDLAADDTIWGAKNYAVEKDGKLEKKLIGASTDAATANTIWGAKNYANTTVKNSLLGASGDAWPTKQTLYGVVKYSDTKNTDLKNALIGSSTDTTINTHYGLKHILIGKSADASTADTIWGAKKHAVEQDIEVKNILRGASTDAATANTIWGAKNYADEKIKTLSNTAFKVSRIEEGGEGILVFSTVTSYAG